MEAVVVVGGGVAGLVATYRLCKSGRYKVTLLEKEGNLGGLASCNSYKGMLYEKYYHHYFKKDIYLIQLIEELGLKQHLIKKKIKNEYKDSLGTIWDFMLFGTLFLLPFYKVLGDLSLSDYYNLVAPKLLKSPAGVRRLMYEKFGIKWRDVLIRWLWARIHARYSLKDIVLGEELLYVEPSFQIVLDRLEDRITEYGGKVNKNSCITNFEQLEKYTDQKIYFAVPNNVVNGIVGEKILSYVPKYRAAIVISLISSRGAGCVKLNSYWNNLTDAQFEPFVVLVNQHLLNDSLEYSVTYIGGYVDWNDPILKLTNVELEARIRTQFEKVIDFSKILYININKDMYAQHIPNREWAVEGKVQRVNFNFKNRNYELNILNFANIDPWDRGVNYAIMQGNSVV